MMSCLGNLNGGVILYTDSLDLHILLHTTSCLINMRDDIPMFSQNDPPATFDEEVFTQQHLESIIFLYDSHIKNLKHQKLAL